MPQEFCAHFYSDIHIKHGDDEKAKIFVRALKESTPQLTHLVLLGDIFDLWFGSSAYFQERYRSVVNTIRSLGESGVKIFFVEGNHDIHMNKFWTDQLKARVYADELFLEFGSIRVRCEHGDKMNPEDKNYLILRKILRSTPFRYLSETLPGNWIAKIADPWSAHSRKACHGAEYHERDQSIRMMMARYAQKSAGSNEFDLLITGHTHVREDKPIPGTNEAKRFINLGSWLEQPTRFELSPTEGKFVDL